jgi:hypothetical protein
MQSAVNSNFLIFRGFLTVFVADPAWTESARSPQPCFPCVAYAPSLCVSNHILFSGSEIYLVV